ncbi:hypothetical protein [Rubritepida flocculans]|uniref:hypothetical protein n=1 Tax=Rubritepida flocculans TaxID=182403 RepID=UPI00041BC806|nr:hypothetical protein [Rubritepida flocculans]
MSDTLPFRSEVSFSAPQANDRFQGERVRYAGTVEGQIRLEFFNRTGERCTLSFPAKDLKSVLDFRTLFGLFRR